MPRTKLKPKILETDLVDIKQAASKFGRGWSARSVMRKIEAGDLLEGKHFIDDAPKNGERRSIKLIISGIQDLRGIPRYER
jgi:hypothetical protein